MGHTPRSVWLKSIAVVAGLSLALTACGGSDSSTTTSSSTGGAPAASSGGTATGGGDAPAATTGIVTGYNAEPQNPLIPTNTNETGGGDVLDLIFAGLVYYDVEGVAQQEIADSISTTDSQNFDIKIKSGWKFSNGEAITASSFVDAWNYGALVTNAQLNSNWFDAIEGYADVSYCEPDKGPADADGKPTCLPAPKAQTMSGLKVVSDTEFTVKLSSPQSDFPLRLGYAAYYPMAKAGLADVSVFADKPISNGPYLVSNWEHSTKIEMTPNPDYKGPRKPLNGGVTFVFYTTPEAGYADLRSDNLDVINLIPPAETANFQNDLGDHAVNQPGALSASITIPQNLPHFETGEEGALRRAAISMAIDRASICTTIFTDTRLPVKDFLTPTIQGSSDTLPGSEVLTYNEAKAKELWAQADAISPWSGTFTISYNTAGGHKDWIEAVVDQLKNTLGINAEPKAWAQNADFRTAITSHTIGTAFRTAWQADYPSPYNFLDNLYYTGAGSNDGQYTNPAVDKLIDEGIEATNVDEGIKKFQDAEQILYKDLPAIPLWYYNVVGGYSTKVSNVKFDWHGVPVYYAITKE